MASWAAVAGTMPNPVLVAGRSPPEAVATSVYAVPTRSTLKPLKVATPSIASTAVGPLKVPPAGLLPRASRTLVDEVSTVLPWASWTATVIAGLIA